MASRTPPAPAPPPRLLLCALAWFVPGAGHLWLGRRRAGLVFLVTLPLMFGVGLWLEGRLFPFELLDPLVGLAAVADLLAGLPYVAARLLGWGDGQAAAATYEYGNAFLITAGLLNTLAVMDAQDILAGRK
ncbi:MAG: DUF6677 family protein [Acidobacteriota bacterium]